jgi:hypothetical protein
MAPVTCLPSTSLQLPSGSILSTTTQLTRYLAFVFLTALARGSLIIFSGKRFSQYLFP